MTRVRRISRPKIAIRAALAVSVLLLWALASAAQTKWDLVTPDEDRRDRSAPQTPAPPDLPPPPVIELLRPDVSKPVRNPVTIDVQFSAGSGAAIDMQSFRATYGWLGLDITNRVLEHAIKTPNSLSAQNVSIPSGSHRVTISIANTSGKRASKTFQLSVVQ
jgi:hypothetical protein